MAARSPRIPIGARADEQRAFAELDAVLHAADARRAKLITADGGSRELPETAVLLLRQIAHSLATGQMVALLAIEKQLTTQQAADLLNVSRPYVVQLLERGEIPFTKTGAHRRIAGSDLIAYRERRDAGRRQAMAEITRLGEVLEELGVE